jgi:hypothetical protein
MLIDNYKMKNETPDEQIEIRQLYNNNIIIENSKSLQYRFCDFHLNLKNQYGGKQAGFFWKPIVTL